jgi:RNA polymerase sigma factor (sigma-70 family)
MSDSAIVASIVAGEPEGLAAAYDKYAGDLYGYCRSLLQEPDDAADAVQDTFVIAASKLAGLRDPERLRAWLFSVARNECLRRLKSRRASTPLHDAPEQPDESVDVGAQAERAETVALVRAAVGGLNDGERDVINQLWHGLEVSEVAAVLGVSRNHAYALFSRARDHLEASVAVLLVGRAGRGDCATLDSLLHGWDGRLTALLRKRVGRHIDRCPVCSDRRRKELTPALLYGVSPAAVLGLAVLRRGAALRSGSQFGGPLSVVRGNLLRLAADPGNAGSGPRGTHSFGGNGFPRPARHGHLGVLRQVHLPLAAGGTAAAAAAAVFVTVPHPPPAPPGRPPGLSAPVPGGVPQVTAVPSAGGAAAAAPRGAATGAASGAAPRPAATSPVPAARTAPAATPTAPGAPTAGPGPGPGTAPASAPGTAATTTTTAPATAVAATAAGSLTVSPTTVLLSPLLGGTLTLTASGGPVSWSIAEPASLLGKLTVSPRSGSLDAGGSVTVTLSVTGLATLDSRLTVSPGGQAVTVVLGLG